MWDLERLGRSIVYLDQTLPGVVANLALDEALLAEADKRGGPPVLRVWELPEHAVVLGATCPRNQAARVDVCEAERVPIARRSSGGGTVVIGPGAFNVAVVLPLDLAVGLTAVDVAQRLVLERFAEALRREGLPVSVQGSGDLTLGPRKFSGSAQRRLRTHLLIHATILYDFRLDLITRYLGPPRRQPAYRAGRSHDDFVTNLPLPRDRLLRAVQDAWLPGGPPFRPSEVPIATVQELVETRLGDPTWIERF